MRAVLCSAIVVASVAAAHDVSVDLTGAAVAKSEANPRAGSVGAAGSGSYDLNDTWSLFGGLTYTRDLGTKTTDTVSPGTNIFLINAGTLFIPNSHLMFMVSANFSPTVRQQNATTISFDGLLGLRRDSIDLKVISQTTSGGASFLGSYVAGGFSDLNHIVDLLVGVTGFNTYQQLEVPLTAVGTKWRTYCAKPDTKDVNYCPLVNGVTTPLVQARIGATYTLSIKRKYDVGLDGAVYVYSADPNSVGYYSVLEVGRLPDLGSGVPVAPYAFTGKIIGMARFEKLAFRLSYQYGHYLGGYGANHWVSLRTSYKFTPGFKLTLTTSGQGDATSSGFINLGVQGSLGALLTF